MHNAVPDANAAFPPHPPRAHVGRGAGSRVWTPMQRWLLAAAAALTLPGAGVAAPAGKPPAAAGVGYTVQRGDTVSAIAEHLEGRGRWGAIRRLNPGLRIHHITPGRVLLLPEARLRAQPTAARVAGLVGAARVDANALAEGMELRAGQTLHIDPEGFVMLDAAPFTSYGPTVVVHANGYQVD
ncbi:MAG: LysM peptidoglycan-binding domain-containing protein, partial [Burkholderiales bacterium]|nr:LysM peptidoglycan-binding domain-containing protein [Burkholderiales bacterium]